MVPPCHVLLGISRIADPRCKFPCGRKPRNSERRYAGSDATCPCLDQRPRLTRGIADRDSLCKRFTTLETPMPPNPDSPGSSATCPPDDRRLRLNREIAYRDFNVYGTHTSTNAEVRIPDGAWTCWCRRVKSLAPSLRSNGCWVSVWDLTAQIRFLRNTVMVQYIFVPPLFYEQLHTRFILRN